MLFNKYKVELQGSPAATYNANLVPVHLRQLRKVMTNIIRQGLRIRSTSTSTSPNRIMQLHNLITNTVGDVGSSGGTRVSPHDYSVFEWDGHDRRSGGEFSRFEVSGFCGFAIVLVVCFFAVGWLWSCCCGWVVHVLLWCWVVHC